MTSTLIARLSMIILALVIGAASAGAYAYAGGATTPVADQAYTRRLPTPAPTATLVPAPVADDADLASADRRLKTDPFVRTELFFGSERPNKPEVSDAEFKQFLDEEVTPRFPDGLTVRLNSAAAQSDARCFPETGFCISGRIREYWEQNGGLAVFGFPLTPARDERNRDTGQAYLTQWFE
ncbi:MAG TPA: DUF3574 domain-containing protein, partial [Roseiflexaceae bacterium]|nr:DUF3574 domain-containing protein [Roseiflexaceae bacterium]